MRSASLLLAAMLSGCATKEVIVEVRVPVPVPCIATVPREPVLATDAELLAMDDYRLLLTIARERLTLIGHSGELAAIVTACASLP